MKKIIITVFLLLIFLNASSQTKSISIYSSDSMSISKFFGYRFNTNKNIYFQLSGYSTMPNIDYRNMAIFKYFGVQSSIGNYLPSSFGPCQTFPSQWTFGFVDDFSVSVQDSSLKLISHHDQECEPYSSILLHKGTTVSVVFPSSFMARPFGVDIDPVNDSVMYVGFDRGPSQSFNFYKTTNRGANWIGIDSVTNVQVGGKIKVNPFNRNIILRTISNGLSISTNGGNDFFNANISSGTISDFKFDYTDNTIYALSNGIYKSSDNGLNWSRIYDSTFNYIEIDPLNNNILYGGKASGLFRSTNKGVNWVLYNNSFSPSKNVIGVAKSAGMGDTLLVATNKGVYKVFGESINDSLAAYLPMKVGYSYTYRWSDQFQSGFYRAKITKDTVINGYKYYYFLNFPWIATSWVRYDTATSKLLKYSTNPCAGYTQDQLIDSLGSRINDEIFRQCGNFSIWRCVDTSMSNIFGLMNPSKAFFHDGILVNGTRYVKNIGIVSSGGGDPPPGTFSVTLKGCIIDGILYGDTTASDRSISGTVTYSGDTHRVASGMVKLVKFDTLTGGVRMLDSARIQPNGTYFFPLSPPETTYVMAYQDDDMDLSNNFVPTYYPSTIYWENAVKVYAASNLSNVNISVYRSDSSTNNGIFKGTAFSTRNPLAGVVKGAIIYAKVGNSYKNYSITDINGRYSIPNLPYGSYHLISNRLGYTTDSLNFNFTHGVVHDSLNFYMRPLFMNIEYKAGILPDKYSLFQNYPNPFNPVTKIVYQIPERTLVSMKIYDITGRLINTLISGEQHAGEYAVTFNSESLSSGVYFYSLEAGDFKDIKRMVLIK